MPSHTIIPTGALTGLTDTEPKPLVTYGVFQQQGQTPQNVENLQKNIKPLKTIGKHSLELIKLYND